MSRGYVRLVRSGGTRYRFRPRRFHLDDDGEWREVDADTGTIDEEEAAEADAARREQLRWADDEPLHPDAVDAIAEAIKPRGSKGQTSRSRLNLRRLITALPWELLGPRPALVSLTYPGNWQPWVPDGRTGRCTAGRSNGDGSAGGASRWSACGSRSSRPPAGRTCTSTSACPPRWPTRTSRASGNAP